MPLVRYEVRCEHSLANPELYRTVGQDDSEGLLEGVAMAGLVGIVRQLGDLAEFAAEVFHDLHDDVMTIVMRSHELKARVSRLEAELPVVEKALLSEANLYRFAYSAGVKWRASLPINENHCAQGDLPHFVRNFYQECRGPPRLFLLDKFDMAGQGACVKRYSNPTFFRLMWASSEIEKAEQVQRELKAHQEKKSNEVKNHSDKLGPHIYPRERLSSAHFENLEGFSGDFNTPLTPRVQLKRLDQVLESPVNGAGLTPEGSPTPDHNFKKSASHPTGATRGPALTPLKISAKDIENGGMGRRFSRTSEDYDEKSEGLSSGDHFVDALTTMESDMDSDTESRGRWGSDGLRDFEVDKANSQVNHSMLKAHVESQRESAARGVDILERPKVMPDAMKPSSFEHEGDVETVAPSSFELPNATDDRKLPTQSTTLKEYEALKQNGHKDVGHFDPPVGNGHTEISRTEHAEQPIIVNEDLCTQSKLSMGHDMMSSNGHAVMASREGDGISRPANGPMIDGADDRGAAAHSPAVQAESVQQCVDPHVATVLPPAEFVRNPVQNGHDMHSQSMDPWLLAQDGNESTSSAASSPKSSTVRMLLSPPESPPRMTQGLTGSPALYSASFRSERSSPNSLPVVPVLSSSPSTSRIQSPTRDKTNPDSPYRYRENNASLQPPPRRPPLASPLLELFTQECPSPLLSYVSISGSQETSGIASSGPDSNMIKKAAFVDLASTPDRRHLLFEQIRTQLPPGKWKVFPTMFNAIIMKATGILLASDRDSQYVNLRSHESMTPEFGNYPGGDAFSILPFFGSLTSPSTSAARFASNPLKTRQPVWRPQTEVRRPQLEARKEVKDETHQSSCSITLNPPTIQNSIMCRLY